MPRQRRALSRSDIWKICGSAFKHALARQELERRRIWGLFGLDKHLLSLLLEAAAAPAEPYALGYGVDIFRGQAIGHQDHRNVKFSDVFTRERRYQGAWATLARAGTEH